MKIKLLTAAVMTAMTLPMTAQADYAAGDEIKVLQGFKAGGGSDALAQLAQPYLSEILEVNFVNEYIPGATGGIAWTRLAKQTTNDGSVISITNTPMLMTNYIINEEMQYNVDELTPIANVITDPGVIVVGKDSPFESVEDLFEAAEQEPGTVTVGNSGVGGDDYFSTIMVERDTGLKFQKVPFDGDGPSATAAMGDKIDASFNNVGIVYSQIRSGDLRPLAVFAEERLEMLPDVPTLKEKGVDVVAGSSRGYSAPAGIPEEARQDLIAAFEELAENEDFLKRAEDSAFNIEIITGDDYETMIDEMEAEYEDIWDEIKDDA